MQPEVVRPTRNRSESVRIRLTQGIDGVRSHTAGSLICIQEFLRMARGKRQP